MPFEDIEVLHGDTQVSPRGMDTSSLAVGGIAVVKAAEKVVAKARTIAAHLLEASEDDLEFSGGRFGVRGTGKGVTIQEVATATLAAHNLPDGVEPSLDSDATYDPDNFSFPHGTHLAAMEVDTETGRVTIRRYVCVDDVGNALNPLIVEGQVHGGLAQGIAQALFEEANYDEQGTLVNGTFVDYTLPSASDLPSFTTDRTETPATGNRWASRASRRPARSHRRRRSSTRCWTRCATWASRTSRCRARRSACGGPSRRGRAVPPRRRRSTPTRRVPASARSTRTTRRKKRSSDRRSSTTSGPARSTRPWPRCRRPVDAKVLAGGQSLIPVLRLRLAAPSS